MSSSLKASFSVGTTPASTSAECYFDPAERRFGSEQMLQRFLFVGNSVLPLLQL